MKFISSFRDIFSGDAEGNDRKLLRNIIILGIIGVLFLFTGNFFSGSKSSPEGNNDPELIKEKAVEKSYTEKVSKELEVMISLIKGVGEAKVQLFTGKGSQYQYEYNEDSTNKITNETDQNGGERRIEEKTVSRDLVVIKDEKGNEKTVVRVKNNPEIKGVLIVAEGVEDSDIKYEVYRAVSDFLNLPLYKINILPYERR